MKKIKKAELTTTQLVTIIILVTSFVIILFLIFRLNLGETSNKDICHNSVVLKGKSSVFGGLDCKTSYVCISGGDECEGFQSSATIEVDLSDDEVKNKNKVMKVIADEMADCWWMFGEGKVDYFGFTINPIADTHCGVCSVVKFDKTINEKMPKINYDDFYRFLAEKNKDSSQTYLKYLYGVQDLELIEKNSFGEFSTNKENRYLIVTGMKPVSDVFSYKNPLVTWDDYYISPFFFLPSEIKQRTGCDVFDLTKA